jgi:N-acyl homoserine lactone hydrolase
MSQRAITSVIPISTGAGEQHREHRLGSRLPQLWWVLTSRSWVKIPINCFVIKHRDGVVLFDTGMDPAIQSDPNYIDSTIGRFLMKKIFRLNIKPGDALGQQLIRLGLKPASVTKAIISHLHFDHIGGIADIPHAELMVSREEWGLLSTPHPEREWILREHIELPGVNWHPIDLTPTEDPLLYPFNTCFDVMGDGSLVALPTPGHTAGSLSLLVREEGMTPLLLVGDLTYDVEALMTDQVPGTGDETLLRKSFAKVRAMKERIPDLIIVPSHDAAAVETLRRM